jgi:hypothetical protein
MFYPELKFTIFDFKISFAVVYFHTIWTFTLKGRISIVGKALFPRELTTQLAMLVQFVDVRRERSGLHRVGHTLILAFSMNSTTRTS